MAARLNTVEKIQWFHRATASIFNQTVECEFVIVDDGYVPFVPKLLPHKMVVIGNERGNYVNALNEGLKHCTGDIVINMDADDIAEPNLVESLIKFFDKNPEAVACGVQASAHHWETWEELTSEWWPTHHPEVVTREYAYNSADWFINHPGSAVRRSVIEQIGGYRDAMLNGKPITQMEDLMMWIDILKAGYVINNLPDILMNFRFRDTPAHRLTEEYIECRRIEKEALKNPKKGNKQPKTNTHERIN